MKIGRNDPCPCGSGKKYKKCCLLNGIKYGLKKCYDFLNQVESNFRFTNMDKKEVRDIFEEYVFTDLVKAVFCINLWRRNRSALEQSLYLNKLLINCGAKGKRKISNYADFVDFFERISKSVRITPHNDYIIDDYGEVFINHQGKSYPVIIGTGHQQVYPVLRYMQTLSSILNKSHELTILLEYEKIIMDFTKEKNTPCKDNKILFEVPSEDFWNCINELFDDDNFNSQACDASNIMGYQNGPIEMRHFIARDKKIYPLYNTSILVDYYKILLNTATEEEKEKHFKTTLYSLLNGLFNVSTNSFTRVFIEPIINTKENEKILRDGIIFVGYGKKGLLIGLKKNKGKEQKIIDTLEKINETTGFNVIESFSRIGNGYAFGAECKIHSDITYMIIDPFTDITSHFYKNVEDGEKFSCNAIDAYSIIGFSSGIDEIIEFIKYDERDETRIFTFGGVAQHFFLWKKCHKVIASGAIEYDQMNIDYNETEDYISKYFSEELSEFPHNSGIAFNEILCWNIKNGSLGYKHIEHKGLLGFGGEIKKLNNIWVFLAHNIEFITKEDLSVNNETALGVIEELNERLFVRYSDLLNNMDILKGKTLEMLYVPINYAKSHNYDHINDLSRTLAYSDEYIAEDLISIRFSVDVDNLMSRIQESADRSAENMYFKELIQPLAKYDFKTFESLEKKLEEDSAKQKTVGVFTIQQQYYYSGEAVNINVSESSLVKVRKEIAKTCLACDIVPGSYYGKEATANIRKMQTQTVSLFEKYLSEFDMFDLHKKALSYNSVQQHGVIINLQRYSSFENLDPEVKKEFEESTRDIREEYRKNLRISEYLLESNLSVKHTDTEKICSREELEFLIAFSDWLVTLQETADTCFHSEKDYSVFVDEEYKLNIVLEGDTEKQDSIIRRKYDNKDYTIKGDKIDEEYLEKAIKAFEQDTDINFIKLITFLEYLQLWVVEEKIAKEICPNVFEAEKEFLKNGFLDFIEEKIKDDEFDKIVDFLTLDCTLLKNIGEEKQDVLPIWEREKRDNRFNVKPIIKSDKKYVFSPVNMNNLISLWKFGLVEWYLPYEIGLSNVQNVLKKWKKRYEKEMVKDIEQIFRSLEFDLVEPEIELQYRFPKENYPKGLGDYDIFAVDIKSHEIWLIESKVLQKVGSIYEDQMQQKSFFFQNKYDEKFERRIKYIEANTNKVLDSLKIEKGDYTIKPYMVTNKLFVSRYKDVPFEIITYYELEKILKSCESI